MRTTVSISDHLLERAKKASLERKCTLGEVIDEALTLSLITRQNKIQPRESLRFPTYGKGGTHPGVDMSSNASLADLMDSP